jgi:hypothetical protein
MSCAPANRVFSRRGKACSQRAAGRGYCPSPGYSGRGLALTWTAASGQQYALGSTRLNGSIAPKPVIPRIASKPPEFDR